MTAKPRYDMHTHTFLSDGELLPMELIRRALVAGHEAIAITDHVSFSNVEEVVRATVRDCDAAAEWDIAAIPGVEVTHVPPRRIAEVASLARKAGAEIIVVHGESPVEPVASGTNKAAVENPDVDILAHPGLLTEEEAELALENGTYIEISCRKGHSLANGHVYDIGSSVGADFLVNTDAHSHTDLSTHEFARRVALGAGMSETEADRSLLTNPKTLMKKRGIV